MNSVLVKFQDSKYNYETSVSEIATEKSCRNYFVGKLLNLSNYRDNMRSDNIQKCIDIEFKQEKE